MKNYTITVNGKVYDVSVEEKTGGASAPASAQAAPQPAPAPVPAPAPAPAAGDGTIQIEAGAAGKVVDIVATPGTAVKRGDNVVILEVMKMETPVVAPEDGTVASIVVEKGQQVAAGDLLATMN